MIPQRGSSLKTSPGIPSLTQSLVKDLYALCKDETSCDLTFLVGVREERVMAHKLIVLARCENYKHKKDEWLAATRMIQVKLGKHSRESVKKVVKYLYTGEVSLSSCCYQMTSWDILTCVCFNCTRITCRVCVTISSVVLHN